MLFYKQCTQVKPSVTNCQEEVPQEEGHVRVP
nr:MAG TPA: hypothetical protein [Siphoviridae sp. ctHdl3]